jgi:formylglycine-generating enzyme required for sulfatase activity
MKNVSKAILVLGVISFWLGAISGCGEKQNSLKEVVSNFSQTNEEKAFAGEAQSSLEQEKTINLGNDLIMELVLIPAGSFYMGTPSSEKSWLNYDPVSRLVQITRPFYMGKYEVTQGHWKAVMGTTVRQQRDKYTTGLPLHGVGSDFPMYYVSWDDAVAFCKKLGSGFRLPTEAEWEYACRAGSDTHFCFGDDPNCFQISFYAYSQDNSSTEHGAGQKKPKTWRRRKFTYGDEPNCYKLGQYAWYKGNSFGTACYVGLKKPNAWGLYDMHGNAGEWCADWATNNFYHMTSVDPTGPANGKYRVVRSGSWSNAAEQCRSASRSLSDPNQPNYLIGFRIVMDPK